MEQPPFWDIPDQQQVITEMLTEMVWTLMAEMADQQTVSCSDE